MWRSRRRRGTPQEKSSARAAIRTRTRMVASRGLTPPSQVVASQAAIQERDRKNNVAPAPVPRKLPDKTAPQPYVAPADPVRFPPKTPGLTNQQSHSTPPPPPPPPPASSSAPPPASSSSARGMPTSSIVAIVLAGIVGIIMILMAGFYIYDSYDQKSTGDQRRTRHAQRRY